MFKLILNTMKQKKGIYLGTFISIILAMLLLTMCWSLLMSSIIGNKNVTRYVNTDLIVMPKQKINVNGENTSLKGTDYIENSIIEQLKKINGINNIIKDYTFYAIPINESNNMISSINGANVVAHSWKGAQLTNFKLIKGNQPGEGQIVINKGLAENEGIIIGDELDIATTDNIEKFVVSGITDTNYTSIYKIQSPIFFNENDSIKISRLKGPNALAIKVNNKNLYNKLYEYLKDKLNVNVYNNKNVPIDSVSFGSVDYVGSISLFGTLAGLTIFAAIFVLIGTVSFTIQQRFLDFAILRGIGLTPKQIKKMISIEMFLLTLIGYIIGCPLGVMLTPRIVDKFIEMGAVPRQFELTFSIINLLLVLIVGLFVVLIAAYSASKKISKISPTEAMSQSKIRINNFNVAQTIIGLLFVVGAILILELVPMQGAAGIGFNFLASLCFIIGVATLGDYLIKLMSMIISFFLKVFGAVGNLASSNSKMYSYKMVSASLAITLMIALNGGILINTLTFNEISLKEQNISYEDKTIITPANYGIPWGILEDVDKLFGKDNFFAKVNTDVYFYGQDGDDINDFEIDDYDALGISCNSKKFDTNINILSGDISKLNNSDISISQRFANKYKFNIGQKIKLYFNDKVAENFTIVAMHSTEGFDSPDFIFNSNVVREHDPQSKINNLYIDFQENQINNKLTFLKVKWPVIVINGGQSSDQQQQQNLKTQNAVIYMMIIISLLFTIIAICNTFVITISSRKEEYKNLWLLGATPRQILKMISLESWTIILVGVILGSLITSSCIGVYSSAQGLSINLIGNPNIYFGLIGISVVISLVSSKLTAIKTVNNSVGTVKYEF